MKLDLLILIFSDNFFNCVRPNAAPSSLSSKLYPTASNTNLLAKHNVNISNLQVPINWSKDSFIPYDWGHFAFIYNSTLLKNPPNSFNELVNGSSLKIIIQDPRTSTPGLGLLLWVKSSYISVL